MFAYVLKCAHRNEFGRAVGANECDKSKKERKKKKEKKENGKERQQVEQTTRNMSYPWHTQV